MYALGFIMGFTLLLAKYGSFWLFTGGSKQWRVPFTDQGIRDWIYKSPIRTGLLDTAAGYLGMHVLLALGGSIIATVAMVTYIVTCMATIFLHIAFNNIKSLFKSKPRSPVRGRQFVPIRRTC